MSAQIKLNMIEPCYKNGHRQDSCFTMTDVNGIQQYIDFDLLKTLIIGDTITSGDICTAIIGFPMGTPQNGDKILMKTASGICKLVSKDYFSTYNCDSVFNCLENNPIFCDLVNECIYTGGFCDSVKNCIYTDGFCDSVANCVNVWFCDSVESCLDNIDLSDKFCGIIRSYTGGTLQVGDSVMAIQNGVCKKLKVTSLGGTGKVYFEDSDCFHFAEINDSTWTGNIILDPDPTNITECRSMGLYSPSFCAQISTIAEKDMENGLFVYTFDQGEDECYKSKLCLDGDADCVALSFQNVGGSVCISAELVISNDLGNVAECRPSGTYVPSVCKQLEMWSDGGDLANNDIVLVKNGNNCVKKRYLAPTPFNLCGVSDIGCDGNAPCGTKVMMKCGSSCGWVTMSEFLTIYKGCDPNSDIPMLNDITTPLQKRISDLEKQNKDLLKRLEKLEKKLK